MAKCKVLLAVLVFFGGRPARSLQDVDSKWRHLMSEAVRAHKPEHFAHISKQFSNISRHFPARGAHPGTKLTGLMASLRLSSRCPEMLLDFTPECCSACPGRRGKEQAKPRLT